MQVVAVCLTNCFDISILNMVWIISPGSEGAHHSSYKEGKQSLIIIIKLYEFLVVWKQFSRETVISRQAQIVDF